jgi:hypothetical protein
VLQNLILVYYSCEKMSTLENELNMTPESVRQVAEELNL